MKRSSSFAILSLSLTLILMPTKEISGQVTFEANVGIGVTAVDVQAWAYGSAGDWSLFSGTGSVAAYPLQLGNVSIGAEYRFHYFFWYGYYPFGYSYLNDVNVDAHGLMAIIRFKLGGNWFLETGAGPYFFGEWTDWGGMMAVGYTLPLGEKLYIPIKLRQDVVFDADTNLYPLRLNLGIGYRL